MRGFLNSLILSIFRQPQQTCPFFPLRWHFILSAMAAHIEAIRFPILRNWLQTLQNILGTLQKRKESLLRCILLGFQGVEVSHVYLPFSRETDRFLDVILTPLKPQLKNVTAEDVASSLFYLHLNSEKDAQLLVGQEGTIPRMKPPLRLRKKPCHENHYRNQPNHRSISIASFLSFQNLQARLLNQ